MVHDVMLPQDREQLIREFVEDCRRAEQALYDVTNTVTPLASPQGMERLVDNILRLLGHLGKCILTKRLYPEKLKNDECDRLDFIVDNWQVFVNNFSSIEDNLNDIRLRIIRSLTDCLQSKIFLNDGSDLLYFFSDLDFIQLVGTGLSSLSEEISHSFFNDLVVLNRELKRMLTKKRVNAVLHRLPRHVKIDEICYDYLPESYWWRRWR